MNKAFVREPDEPDPRCPRCGVLGESVGRPTLAAHLPLEAVTQLGESACYCANPRCPVAYYDAAGAEVPLTLVREPAYPKDPDAPICSCFGLTAEQVERDARAGDPKRVRELIARAQGPEARCGTAAPGGRSCVGEVQKLFLKHFRAAARG